MADATQSTAPDTITEDHLRRALVERLEASHVEITDMSGTFSLTLTYLPTYLYIYIYATSTSMILSCLVI